MRITLVLLTLIITAAAAPALAGDGDGALVLKPKISKYDYDAIPKDPLASAFFSATFPGTGQIYNKEYVRGAITGVGFYAALYITYYMLDRWEAQNTDTVWVAEVNPETNKNTFIYYRIPVLKPDDEQKGLPTGEKVVLGVSLAATAGFYVWGVIDSYRGAKRYNRKLFDRASRKFDWHIAYRAADDRLGLSARYLF